MANKMVFGQETYGGKTTYEGNNINIKNNYWAGQLGYDKTLAMAGVPALLLIIKMVVQIIFLMVQETIIYMH